MHSTVRLNRPRFSLATTSLALEMFAEQEPYAYLGLIDTVSTVDWIRGRYVTGDTFAFPESSYRRLAYFGPAFKIDQPTVMYESSRLASFSA